MLPIHFAPLQGYTEDAYRRIHHRLYGGVDRYYTPFVRFERGEVRSKDLRDIRAEYNAGVPVVPQVLVADGQELEHLLPYLTAQGYSAIDINMGCPFPLQTRHGKGAGILAAPEKVREVCDVVRQHPELTFSVKMRLGLDDSNQWRDILPMLNDTPLQHITLHPRIATQQYKGRVDRSAFEDFLNDCRKPLIYNGDLRTISDLTTIEADYADTTLSGLMIGRGLLAQPSLAQEYTTGTPWTTAQQLSALRQMHQLMQEHYAKVIPGEAQQLQKLKTFWDFLEPTEDHPTLLERKQWKKIKKAGSFRNYLEAVNSV